MRPERIVFIGSSTIHGRGDTELGGFVNQFRLYFESQSPRHFVYTLGVFGECTDQLIARIQTEVPRRRPHLCVVYPGFNDIVRLGSFETQPKISPKTWVDTQKKLVRACKFCPSIVMTGFPFDEQRTTPYVGTKAFYLKGDAEVYTTSLKEVCKSHNVQLLDLWELWAGLDIDSLLAEDGLHANTTGHKKIFEQFSNFLDRAYS